MRHPVLIAEDDENNRKTMEEVLKLRNYEVYTAKNGIEALKLFEKFRFRVILTDLNMPNMDGIELIEELSKLELMPIIIVQTVIKDINVIIQLIKKGVYDYISKPYKSEEIIHRVEKAFEVAHLRNIKYIAEKERELRYAQHLEWDAWKNNILNKDMEKKEEIMYESMNTIFSQGAGFGALVSIISLIQSKSVEEGDYYKIHKKLFKFLVDNGTKANQVIETFQELNHILHSNLSTEEMTISKFHGVISELFKKLEKYASLKNQTLKLFEYKKSSPEKKISINLEYILKAFEELIFNAMKFSDKNVNIYMLFETKGDKLLLSILNPPDSSDPNTRPGILEEYSHIIFEPYYRISKLVFPHYPTMDFGLGLSLVDKIIKRHGGSISAYNIKSYIEMEAKLMVSFQVEISLV
ncbi:MAG: response regulator [Leptospiraceae bacterium]|nr:response regulator [Leptospiraceae bacterium]